MILAVAATEFEMKPLLDALGEASCCTLLSGVGPVESCLRLTRYLENTNDTISEVVNFGVAGAFISEGTMEQPKLLDICIAETEVFGDLGICYPMRIDDFTGDIRPPKHFRFDKELIRLGVRVLQSHGIKYYSGNFVTVNCASGTLRRGEILCKKHKGLCENMEGAAIARVCEEFSLPLLQVRCISNNVVDRDPTQWSLQQACEKSGRAAALIIEEMGKEHDTA